MTKLESKQQDLNFALIAESIAEIRNLATDKEKKGIDIANAIIQQSHDIIKSFENAPD